MNYKPRDTQKGILEKAMDHIRSVPYKVSARWLFYRLLQDGIYQGKEDYHLLFIPLLSRARKRFYGEWDPETLADDTRELIPGGNGFDNPVEWLKAVKDQIQYQKDKWSNQENYIEVWFEAKAMIGQFRYYTKEIPLLAFGGDVSIPEKWKAAKRLESAAEDYNLPVIVIYFGDDDPKGYEIADSALKDIRSWCGVNFEFIRGGLNPGDGQRLGLPENPDKPGSYQWEALTDTQAEALILGLVDEYYDSKALVAIQEEEKEITAKFQSKMEGLLEGWEN